MGVVRGTVGGEYIVVLVRFLGYLQAVPAWRTAGGLVRGFIAALCINVSFVVLGLDCSAPLRSCCVRVVGGAVYAGIRSDCSSFWTARSVIYTFCCSSFSSRSNRVSI